MSLLASPTGHLTNLSTVSAVPYGAGWLVPMFPRAAVAVMSLLDNPSGHLTNLSSGRAD
ncbi:MAG: hypothetical protein OXK76_11240 [Gammaproteobacteria bacterium]|nr:hypothetical protein [Gammaproteobacteria bacterium]